jgi:CSLREA domain-containing protein
MIIQHSAKHLVIPALFLLLSACGGGGSSNDTPPITIGNSSSAVSVLSSSSSIASSSSSVSISSSSASLIAVAPTIATQPANVITAVGGSATFSITINGGTAPITYQWKRNGSAIAGATSASYTLATAVLNDNDATFSVDIINPAGTLPSSSAVLNVVPNGGYVVNTTADLVDDNLTDGVCHTSTNTCSLRAAIMTTNHRTQAGAKTIYLAAGVFTLTIPPSGLDGEDNGDLNLDSPLASNQTTYIEGDSAATTIIDGNHIDRVFSIASGRYVSMTNLTIRNGDDSDSIIYNTGGGILSHGALEITNSIIENNHAHAYGGGICSLGAASQLLIGRSIIRSNSVIQSSLRYGYGGGVYAQDSITVANSTIEANTASMGGGIYAQNSFGVYNSTVKLNVASEYGGGLYISSPAARVHNSTFDSNGASDGGGIFSFNSNLYLVNSTISGNWATNNGGGINEYTGTSAIYNTTVINNDADHDHDQDGTGGGVYVLSTSSKFIAVNSILAGNTVTNSPVADDCKGTLDAYGWNLFSDVTGCVFGGNGNLSQGMIAVNSINEVLQDNGGSTLTHALLAGSAAIDSTKDVLGCVDETGALLITDQRGAARIAGARCDVGSFEYGSTVPQ